MRQPECHGTVQSVRLCSSGLGAALGSLWVLRSHCCSDVLGVCIFKVQLFVLLVV